MPSLLPLSILHVCCRDEQELGESILKRGKPLKPLILDLPCCGSLSLCWAIKDMNLQDLFYVHASDKDKKHRATFENLVPCYFKGECVFGKAADLLNDNVNQRNPVSDNNVNDDDAMLVTMAVDQVAQKPTWVGALRTSFTSSPVAVFVSF